MEWEVIFKENVSSQERQKTAKHRRTALVQLCDAQKILLIQVSAMESERIIAFYLVVHHYAYALSQDFRRSSK